MKTKIWRNLFLVAVLLVVCVVALNGCGKKEEPTDAQEDQTATVVDENMLVKTQEDLGIIIYSGAIQTVGEEVDGVLKVVYTTEDAFSMVNADYEMRYPSALKTSIVTNEGSEAYTMSLMDEKNTTLTLVNEFPVKIIIEQPLF
jgi:hypothetical protein